MRIVKIFSSHKNKTLTCPLSSPCKLSNHCCLEIEIMIVFSQLYRRQLAIHDWVVSNIWTSSIFFYTYSDPEHLLNELSFQLWIEVAAVPSAPAMQGKSPSSTETHGSPRKQSRYQQLCFQFSYINTRCRSKTENRVQVVMRLVSHKTDQCILP